MVYLNINNYNFLFHPKKQLLSTNLPQRGGDSSGILGFLLRDIRQEANAAKLRECDFCKEMGASVFCHKCRIVFHVKCGLENRCITHFCDQYLSFCEKCAPMDSYRRQLQANPPKNVTCDICMQLIGVVKLPYVAYGDCCRKGFAHRTCMRRYALASGYYLRCPWCRDKKFHDTIKLQSVFVPDRDASWERQPNAYRDLHEKLMRCDEAKCICPKGRTYNKNTWSIQTCTLCAATGRHFKCSVGILRFDNANSKQPDFKCSLCTEVENKLQSGRLNKTIRSSNEMTSRETTEDRIDASFYTLKESGNPGMQVDDETPVEHGERLTDEDYTVLASMDWSAIESSAPVARDVETELSPVSSSVIELSDTQPQLSGALKPPLLLRQSFTIGDYFYLKVYEYDQKRNDCTGTCTLRFALTDARLTDRFEEALQQLQVTESDVWFRDTDRGIYEKIDQYNNEK